MQQNRSVTIEQIFQSYHMGLEAIQNLFTEEHLKLTVYIQQLEAENKQLKETLASLQMEIQKLQATAQKNLQIVINHLLQMAVKSLSRKV